MNANVEDRGIKGDCTPLMEAASTGHVDVVSLLIAHGADVNAQSTAGVKLYNNSIEFIIISVILITITISRMMTVLITIIMMTMIPV